MLMHFEPLLADALYRARVHAQARFVMVSCRKSTLLPRRRFRRSSTSSGYTLTARSPSRSWLTIRLVGSGSRACISRPQRGFLMFHIV